jgi:hypothetical protein
VKGIFDPKDNRPFQITCSADPVGSFKAGADTVSVAIGQRILRFGGEEIWDSVIVQCAKDPDDLTVRVLVCHPAWQEPLLVACIRSVAVRNKADCNLTVQTAHIPHGQLGRNSDENVIPGETTNPGGLRRTL